MGRDFAFLLQLLRQTVYTYIFTLVLWVGLVLQLTFKSAFKSLQDWDHKCCCAVFFFLLSSVGNPVAYSLSSLDANRQFWVWKNNKIGSAWYKLIQLCGNRKSVGWMLCSTKHIWYFPVSYTSSVRAAGIHDQFSQFILCKTSWKHLQ